MSYVCVNKTYSWKRRIAVLGLTHINIPTFKYTISYLCGKITKCIYVYKQLHIKHLKLNEIQFIKIMSDNNMWLPADFQAEVISWSSTELNKPYSNSGMFVDAYLWAFCLNYVLLKCYQPMVISITMRYLEKSIQDKS